jgi:AcrR family transcriptional regulator
MKARAARQRATRDRIVAATVDLHRAIGPARTTIADVARRAGVQRLTVYHAFPTAADLFGACQRRFLSEHPIPDVRPKPGAEPWQALEHALATLYRWYAANEAMERHVQRDRHLLPELDALMARTADAGLASMSSAHAAAIAGGSPSRGLRAFLRLAFAFGTWEALARHRLGAEQIARLMATAARAVYRGQGRSEVK